MTKLRNFPVKIVASEVCFQFLLCYKTITFKLGSAEHVSQAFGKMGTAQPQLVNKPLLFTLEM
jgi:hypothetical protein